MENIVEKRRNCSWGAISPLFHNIFNISLTSKVQLPISLLNVVNQIIFSSILQTWYVELRISRSISESPLEFEITRVDCISQNILSQMFDVIQFDSALHTREHQNISDTNWNSRPDCIHSFTWQQVFCFLFTLIPTEGGMLCQLSE